MPLGGHLLEAVREPKPLGVGINLLPHAVGVLDDLGLLPALRGMAVEIAALVFANKHGQAIYRDPRGLEGGYSHPQFSVHRGELQMLLWREASARLTVLGGQRVTVHPGHRSDGGRRAYCAAATWAPRCARTGRIRSAGLNSMKRTPSSVQPTWPAGQ